MLLLSPDMRHANTAALLSGSTRLSGVPRLRASLRRFARAGLLGLALTCGLTLSVSLGSTPVQAQNAPDMTAIRLQKPPTLRGQFVYWFTNSDRDMSSRQNLPPASADGLLTIPVPTDFRQPDALLNVLDVRRNLIARLPVKGGPASEETVKMSPEGPNLVQNGDFAQGVDRWTAENAGKASATSKVVTDTALPTGVGGKVLRLDVESIDKEAWHAQFYEPGVDLANGVPHTLTFWAKADHDRLVSVISQLDEDDYHNLGLNAVMQVGTQWRKYTVAFTPSEARSNHNRIGFTVGNMLGRVELAGINLQRGVTARPLGPNMLQNAALISNADHWQFSTDPAAQATMQVSGEAAPPAGFEGKVFRIQVAKGGVNAWDVQLTQPDLPLEAEKVYTLTFWGRADRIRVIGTRTDLGNPSYSVSGLDAQVGLTPEWRKYTYVFTTNADKAMHELALHLGKTPGVIELAGLSLQPGAVNPSASTAAAFPLLSREAFTVAYKSGLQANEETANTGTKAHRSHPLVGTWQSFHKDVGLTGKEYQRYRFVFDPNGTGSLQVTSLTENADAPPKSQQNEPFKWQLIEGGPHVSIGSNVYTWAIEKEGKDSPKLKLTLKNYEGKTYILFRQ